MAGLGRILVAFLVAAATAAIALMLWSHWQIRQVEPPLPDLDALRAVAGHADLPVRVRIWNTASQPTPRSLVLTPALDPDPDADYVMSYPAFILEWADGRTLLIDAGMDRASANAFGRMMSWAGAEPLVAHGGIGDSVAPVLANRRLAIVFTHLHTDHTQGVVALCDARTAERPVRLFQGDEQRRLLNATTVAGHRHLVSAGCLESEVVDDAPLAALSGYPGVALIRAAGHTPGSQVVVAWVRAPGGTPRGILFTGDVANHIDGIHHDVPKPTFYRTLVVPESEARQSRVRRFLRAAAADTGFALAPSHDQHQLERIGIQPWRR